jgi:hypothetical protein
MEKYYLTIDPSKLEQPMKPMNPMNPMNTMNTMNQLTIRSVDINNSDSPKTLKKNISNENFIKFQWAWVI